MPFIQAICMTRAIFAYANTMFIDGHRIIRPPPHQNILEPPLSRLYGARVQGELNIYNTGGRGLAAKQSALFVVETFNERCRCCSRLPCRRAEFLELR